MTEAQKPKQEILPPEPLKVGRPSDYHPRFCEMVVEHCANGASLTSFAAEIDQSRSTIGNWMKAHPEFMEACARAKAKSAAWWEIVNRRLAATGIGNQGAAKLGLLNMGADDWEETTKIDHRSGDGSMSPPKSLADFYGEQGK